MAMAHLPQVRPALWDELEKAGGIGERQDIIERVAEGFPVTQADRERTDPKGGKTFDKRVDSAVAQSRRVGWLESVEDAGRGLWKLTEIYYYDNPPY